MPTRSNYESTAAPTSFDLGTGAGAGTLGVRSPDSALDQAFGQSTPAEINGALTTEAKRADLLTLSAEKLGSYNGENPMFPQYRRNFIPAGGTLTEEYVKPRDKTDVPTGTGTGLGNAYTPTIASPGAENGINPTNLRSVQSISSQVTKGAPSPLDNPSNEAHQNTDQSLTIDNVGKVRKFKLGVGSGAANGESPATARGQFPRPPL